MTTFSFGIDLGIASCGWAVIRHPEDAFSPGEITGLGSWMFDAPETDKERTLTNQIRRSNRLLRRVLRRRRNRMAELRRLFAEHGLIGEANADAFKVVGLDPWELRAKGLDRLLDPREFAIALAHVAKRRGFKSAAKRKASNAVDDDQKMLKAIAVTKERLQRYRTIGEMFARDPKYAKRRRNREGNYNRTVERGDVQHEVGELFREQRRLGSFNAGEDLESAYRDIAFYQRPMQDSERLVGMCPFEPDEQRASRMAPSSERRRLLERLVNLRIATDEGERSLTPDELAHVMDEDGRTAILTVKRVRKLIGMPDQHRFTTIRPDQEDRDIASRTGAAMPGTYALRKALGEACWQALAAKPEMLDRIAQTLTFLETNERIIERLAATGLDADTLAALTTALESGAFARFKGAAHISAKAARALLPYLSMGQRYDQACRSCGYDHAASAPSGRAQVIDKSSFNALVAEVGATIANPVARKAMTEGLKQLWAMRNRWGLPDSIHIELAREVGNSLEKRREIENGINKRTADRQRERSEACELLGVADVSGDTLLRYRLAKEQGFRCPYTDTAIPPAAILATDNAFQVDHILPWWRFSDDSYNNKVLCTAAANQRKMDSTPFEWFERTGNADGWRRFVATIEGNPLFKNFKKRNFLLKNAEEVQAKFKSRNLNDTRYAARVLAEAVKMFYPVGERQEKGGKRRVFTRPGALTSALRHAWGLESLKKFDGKRVEDARHHALDALVVAAVSDAEVQHLTKSYQEWEQRGLARPLRQVPEPWPGFRAQAAAALRNEEVCFVARPERRRARGEGHAATIRQVVERDGAKVVYERKSIEALKPTDLDRIKDPERNAALIEELRRWMEAGRPAGTPPLGPTGDPVGKVRLKAKTKLSVPVRGGTADRGEIVRVDVFARHDKRGRDKFYLVPIYPHQVMNKRDHSTPPMRAIVAYRDDEADWVCIDDAFSFRFSLYPRSYVEVVKPNQERLIGYFGGVHRGTGAITLFTHFDPKTRREGIGAQTLLTMKKYSVDRFGRRAEVTSEARTWHGEVCTLRTPPA